MRIASRSFGTRSLAAALALCLATSACHRQPAGEQKLRVRTTLRVENNAFLDMTVYVIQNSQRIRLGIATGNATSTFTIPPFLIAGAPGPLRFLADPIGGSNTPVSEEIIVETGQTVTLTIPPN